MTQDEMTELAINTIRTLSIDAVDADYETLGRPSVTLEDMRRFRQLDSRAPGHPEYRWVSGVETTTGPLGQGVATSVGMAIAQKWLASRYNKPEFPVFDYRIYAVCGDGCMMEGVAAEAASLAGALGSKASIFLLGGEGKESNLPSPWRGTTRF